ncbi:glycosyltransferase family 2 protein [Nocardioides agariphilus]|uniref:glycosyltransferase family 2 protein n=1 Tax=Nocardioides agariphilus TaxID=433664 RepID=UPI003522C5C7
MTFLRRRPRELPRVSVVVPAYGVEDYLAESLDSVLAQQGVDLEVVVVDDGSPDRSGEIADAYAARDDRVRVLHVTNGGLGAARNVGTELVTGDYLAFLDSDDVLPSEALSTLASSLVASGSDFVTGSIVRWEDGRLDEPPWMRRLHRERRTRIEAREHPEVLGDVFAWNKLYRLSFWRQQGLEWPEGVRYEDQPTTTRAYLAGTFDVISEVVYHWRIRRDGTSITQQRASLADLSDRLLTKRMALDAVQEYDDPGTSAYFVDRVMAGDLHRYFVEIPDASDEWWLLLRQGIGDLWGEHSLVHSGLLPVHRLVGWLVEQDRREDAASVVRWLASLGGAAPRAGDRLAVPPEVLDTATVDPAALTLRDHELS